MMTALPEAVEENRTALSLFLEVGVEEMPARVIAPALAQLAAAAKARFSAAAIAAAPPKVYGTPRRLILYLSRVAATQAARAETVIGPPKRVAFDPSGRPTTAAIGFAKSQQVPLSEIQVKAVETLGPAAKGRRGDYLVLEKLEAGRKTVSLLPTLLPEILAALSFPRAMRWNASGRPFVRPIRWIAALYDGKVVPFSFAGVAAGGLSRGHRLMAPDPFRVGGFSAYQRDLRARYVLIDPEERIRVIQDQMAAIAEAQGGRLETGEGALVREAAWSTEYPKAVCGRFNPDFLAIPKEIIVTAMAEHQGYFPLYSETEGLLPAFVTIANIACPSMETIIRGNERVLRARLFDARFYFEQDRRRPLADRAEVLQGVVFQEKLGTLKDKTARLVALSRWLGSAAEAPKRAADAAVRAARLCKCDLVTGVVREFPSLQGTMGRIYAALDGESPEAAAAIEAHYLPKTSSGALPDGLAGRVLAIADKLDTLVGCFGAGLIPSGSEDPYALRRQGLGIIQIIAADAAFRALSLADAVKAAREEYLKQKVILSPECDATVIAFLARRLDAYLETRGVRYDLRDAVLAVGIDPPADRIERANALVRFSKAVDFGPLMTAFKRAIRILPDGFEGSVETALLRDPAEKALHAAIASVDEASAAPWRERRYLAVLSALATFFAPLNRFFDDVLVMDPDPSLRRNRLALLHQVKQRFYRFADFSKVVEEG